MAALRRHRLVPDGDVLACAAAWSPRVLGLASATRILPAGEPIAPQGIKAQTDAEIHSEAIKIRTTRTGIFTLLPGFSRMSY